MNEYIVYTEGRDTKGNVIYKDGDEGLMRSICNGTYTYGKIEVTKPFLSAPNVE